MASENNNDQPQSYGEEEEKPVREQLKKASLESEKLPGTNEVGDDQHRSENIQTESGDSPRSKRSFEEAERGQRSLDRVRHHTRKRSRDSTTEENELNNGQRKTSGERPRDSIDDSGQLNDGNGVGGARPNTPDFTAVSATDSNAEAVASPKIKRSRLQASAIENGTLAKESTETVETVEPGAKSSTKIPPMSGFANTSAVSPFGVLAGSKSPSEAPLQTSQSAFKASGLGALAASPETGFAALGKSSSGFGSGGDFSRGGPSTSRDQDKMVPPSAFGSPFEQKSAFVAAAPVGSGLAASAASGFGKLGSSAGLGGVVGFGSLASAGGKLTSFASGKPSSLLASGSKPNRVFGTKTDEDDDEGEDEGEDEDVGVKSPIAKDEDKQDERFYKQSLETGEEDEMTVHSARAKLYSFVADGDGKKEWRERGLGVLRLNVKKPGRGESEPKPKARFLMRAEGSHRVVLNTPIKKEFKFGAPDGAAPQGSYMFFMGTIEGKTELELLQLKMKAQFAKELHEKIMDLQKLM